MLAHVICWHWLYFLIVWDPTDPAAVCLGWWVWWRKQNTEISTEPCYYTKHRHILCFICYMSYARTNILLFGLPRSHSHTHKKSYITHVFGQFDALLGVLWTALSHSNSRSTNKEVVMHIKYYQHQKWTRNIWKLDLTAFCGSHRNKRHLVERTSETCHQCQGTKQC